MEVRAVTWLGWVVGVGLVLALALAVAWPWRWWPDRGGGGGPRWSAPGGRRRAASSSSSERRPPPCGWATSAWTRVGQHAEEHHGGDHDEDGGRPAGPVVHGVEGVALGPVGAGDGDALTGGVVAEAVTGSGVVEDQRDLGVGELVVAPDRDRGDRAAGADVDRRAVRATVGAGHPDPGPPPPAGPDLPP